MSSAAGKNRLEMFLALNAEAFKRGLADAGQGLSTMSNQAGISFTQTKNALGENVDSVRKYNAELTNQGGILQTLGGHVGALVGAMAASFSVLAGMQKLVDVTREFDKINAGLITATGSIEKSKVAFAVIQDFAAQTPYALAQVSEGFIKLVNFGLNPSERALKSYGNASSALGKDLTEMIEAVADAATGEFERLKEFGIKSKVEGDNVSFTFRGITETVGKNAKEIEEYLIKLGEVNFGDAMANRMATLDGAMSNLGDAWDKLFLTISNSGIGAAIAEGVAAVTKGLEELSAMVASGQLLANLKAMAGQWSAWGDDVNNSIKLVGLYFNNQMEEIERKGYDTSFSLSNAFESIPTNLRTSVRLLTVTITAALDDFILYTKSFGKQFAAAIKGDNDELARLETEYATQLNNLNQAREESLDAILNERNAALESYTKQIAAAKKLREEYDKTKEAGKASKSDRFEQFRIADDSDIDAQVAQKEYQQKQKDTAKKRQSATVESVAKKLDQWDKLEMERPLTKEEIAAKKEDKRLADELARETREAARSTNDAAAAQVEQTEAVRNKRKRDAEMVYVTETSYVETEDGTQKQDREYKELFAENARLSQEAKKTSTGSISAHGNALTEEEWRSLSKEQQTYLVKEATRPRSSWDYFSNKSGDRFKGDVDPTAALANAATMMVNQNRTRDEQKNWLDSVVNAALRMTDKRASGIGNISAYIDRMLNTMDEDGNLRDGGRRDSTRRDQQGSSPSKIHELRFKGGRLQGSESDIENLLDQLAQAGMSAG